MALNFFDVSGIGFLLLDASYHIREGRDGGGARLPCKGKYLVSHMHMSKFFFDF